jgi:hypothetical protein
VSGTGSALNSTKPSAILRIKAGTTEFDKSYYLNFESLSGGLNITNWHYLGNNIYLTRATTNAEKGPTPMASTSAFSTWQPAPTSPLPACRPRPTSALLGGLAPLGYLNEPTLASIYAILLGLELLF